jgi:hypothetical protein
VPNCGDGFCSDTEDCHSCSPDCGACSCVADNSCATLICSDKTCTNNCGAVISGTKAGCNTCPINQILIKGVCKEKIDVCVSDGGTKICNDYTMYIIIGIIILLVLMIIFAIYKYLSKK